MNRPDLSNVRHDVVELIVSQAGTLIDAQVGYASAQDTRSNSLLTASGTLAGVAAGFSVNNAGKHNAVAVAAAIGALGFAFVAALLLWSLKSRGFHARGWHPRDFEADIQEGKGVEAIWKEIAQDLEFRLRHNKAILDHRGKIYNFAAVGFVLVPVVALVVGLVVASPSG